MGILQSSKVAAGIDILADHFNKLREDLTSNHDHGAGKGGSIDHKDLAETDVMSGMAHQHGDIKVHLLGGGPGPEAIDNPGGDEGVHGLASGVMVPGYLGSTQVVFQCGVESGPGDSGTIGFPFSFSSIIGVIVSYSSSSTSPQDEGVSTNTHTVDNFKYEKDGPSVSAIYWLAWGTK